MRLTLRKVTSHPHAQNAYFVFRGIESTWRAARPHSNKKRASVQHNTLDKGRIYVAMVFVAIRKTFKNGSHGYATVK